MRKLIALVLVSSAGCASNAMQKELVTAKEMTNQMVVKGIQSLPLELTEYIVSLLVQSTTGYTIFLLQQLPVFAGFTAPTPDRRNSKVVELARILQGHEGNSDSDEAIISPDGKTIIKGSKEGIVRVSDSQTGKLIITLNGHSDSITSLTCSSNGETIITGSDDSTACIWSLKTGELVRILKGHTGGIYSVVLSETGDTIITASYDATVRLWNLRTGELLRVLKEKSSGSNSVSFDLNGGMVALAEGNTMSLWKIERDFKGSFEEHQKSRFKHFMTCFFALLNKEDDSIRK